MTEVNKDDVFKYLNNLRRSGKVNMFASVPYLRREFGLLRSHASELLTEWTNKFNKDKERKPRSDKLHYF